MIYKIIEIIITLFIGFGIGYQIGIFRESLWYAKLVDQFKTTQDNACRCCIFKISEQLKTQKDKK